MQAGWVKTSWTEKISASERQAEGQSRILNSSLSPFKCREHAAKACDTSFLHCASLGVCIVRRPKHRIIYFFFHFSIKIINNNVAA
jgi:hypothetical protein